MASIFQRLTNVARANLGPAVERQVRRGVQGIARRGLDALSGADRGASSSDGGRTSGRGLGAGRGTSAKRTGPVYAGPAEVRTVEVGGRKVTTATRAYDIHRRGLPTLEYAPRSDGRPDPGEVVWTWIPYDDDPSQGKDRPALVLAEQGDRVVLAQLTSRDRASGGATTDQFGRVWFNVGTGAWDRAGRPSEVRLDKLWLVDEADVRREGAALDRDRYIEVARRLRLLHS